MTRRSPFRSLRRAKRVRARKSRLIIESLEDRTVPADGQWLAVIGGISPAPNLPEQASKGERLLQSAGVLDENVHIVEAMDLSGTFLVQTPPEVTYEALTTELMQVPGFYFVTDYPGGPSGEAPPPGTWTQETNLAPSSIGTMMLLTDGRVMAQLGGVTKAWYQLRPDANGSYVNGTWSPLASMGLERLYFGSNVLRDGKIFLVGGEYSGPAGNSNWINSGEIYDPVANTWSPIANFPQTQFGDDPTEILPDGRILAGYLSGPQTYIYDPASNTWTFAANKLRGDRSDEESWVLLPDGSILSYDIFSSPATGPGFAQRYIPSTNTWVDAGSVPIPLTNTTTLGAELGPAFLLPDGRVFQIGANSNTALYSPATNTWTAGPTIPNAKGADDAPGAVTPDGHVIFAADTPLFNGPTQLFDFDPVANTITQITSLPAQLISDLGGPAYTSRMLMLPNGQMLLTTGSSSRMWVYTSGSGPADAWRPTISTIAPNTDGTFTLTGTQLNGISEGASYGDDAEMSSNYPIVQLTNASGNVFYARTYNWSNTGVATGSTPVTTQFALPAGLPDGQYSLTVIANGIASAPVPFSKPFQLSVLSSTPAAGSVVATTPTSYVMNFSEAVDPASLQAGDLLVNGNPADSVTLNSPTSATFTFTVDPVTTEGLQTMAIAAGSIIKDGDPSRLIAAFNATFRYDTVPLAVTATAPPVGGVFTLPAPLTLVVTFNEPITAGSVGPDDLTLSAGTVTAAFASGPNEATYTIGGVTAEGSLTVTLGAGKVTDAFGNPNPAAFTGSYALDFGTVAFPTPLAAKLPLGSTVYDPGTSGVIAPAGDQDSFTLVLDPGQTISVSVTPGSGSTLRPTVTLLDPSNNVIGTATASANGKPVALLTVPTVGATPGTYSVRVEGAGGSSGSYSVQVTLNAALDTENVNGPSNDSIATAQNIDGSATSLGGSATRLAVVGTTGVGAVFGSENFESGVLPASITTFSSNSFGRIRVTAPGGSGNTSAFALLMDSNTDNNFALNEAVYTVDLTGATQANLSFSHINFADESDVLPTSFTGHFNGDGVAISADGVNWRTILSAPTNSTWTTTTIDLAAAAAAAGMPLGPNFKIKFQQYDNFTIPTDGRGYDNIVVAVPDAQDVYSLNLVTGETATVALKALNTGTVNVALRTAGGVTLASGAAGSTNLDKVISDFAASADGPYYLVVTGTTATNYDLVVTRNAAFSTEPNNTLAAAQSVLSQQGAGDQYVLGHVGATGDAVDLYGVTLAAGATLDLQTFTPADGSGEFANTFNPRLRVLDSSGAQLAADDDSAPDGKNALLSFTNAGATGTFFVEVSSTTAGATQGEYVLRMRGNTVTPPALQVTTTNPANGARLRVSPTQFTVDFNDALLQTTIAASDLRVDGLSATSFTVVDADTIAFNLPGGLANGTHTVTVAAGAIADVQNTPLQAFTSTFIIDNIAPRVTATSLAPNAVLPPGSLSYQVSFSEPMLTSNLTSDDFSLRGNARALNYSATTFSFDPSGTVLTLNYTGLPDDNYTLTLVSGASGGTNFTDLAGNALDGEFTGTFPSGNGTAGGNFVVGFNMDPGAEAYPTPLTAEAPLGSLIYDPTLTRVIAFAGDTDSFTLAIDPGQTITVVVSPGSAALRPSVELRDPSNAVIGSATAAAAGQKALLQTVAVTTGGIYTMTVSGAAGTTGLYTVQAILNAAQEAEGNLAGVSNNTAGTAQDLNPSFVTPQTPLGGAQRGAALGRTDNAGYAAAPVTPTFVDISTTGTISTATGDDASQTLSGAQLAGFAFPFFGTTYTSIAFSTNGLITFPSGDTTFINTDLSTAPSQAAIAALWDDLNNPNTGSSRIYWQVVGSGASQQLVVQWNNVQTISGGAFFTFEAILSANGNIQLNYGSGVTTTNVVSSATVGVKAPGTSNPPRLLLSFNQSQGPLVGPNLSTLITPPSVGADYYAFALSAGETATVAVTGLSAGNLNLELRNGSDATLATGAGGFTNLTKVVSNFVAGATATYYVRVTGDSNVPYSLVVTRNAAFDSEGNDTFGTPQSVDATPGILGAISTTADWYAVNVASTANYLQLATSTPADGPNQFVNNLNPQIDLFDPSGNLVASGVVQGDGRNESLQYQPLTTGVYRIRVTGEAGTTGEYFVSKNFSPAVTTSVTSPVNENDTATLSGTINDPDSLDSHTVVITWGPDEGSTTLNLAAGVSTFGASHQYLDDNPSGSASDDFPINVVVTDNHGASGTAGTAATVNNVAPSNVVLNSDTIDENGTFSLSGSFDDPGTQDSHTVLIDWGPGEGTTTLDLPAGVLSFSASHQYLDDNPSGTDSDDFAVAVTATDDDTGSGSAATTVTVNNVAPSDVVLNSDTIDENGTFSLSGSFTDVGTLDTHTVVIDWGTGEGSTTLNLAAGVSTFSATHQYLDDNPTGTPFDTFGVNVTVTDDDTGVASGATSVAVNNVAPSNVVLNSGTIDENGTFTLSGSFVDPGTLDTHTVVINWGTGEGSTTLNLAAGASTFSASHQYLDDNPTGTPSDTFGVDVTVTDDDTGAATAATTVTVNNVAPVVGPIVGPSAAPAVRGQTVAFAGSFTDVGTLDTHQVSWDFGDGTVFPFHPSTDAGALTPTHVFTAEGTYTVTLTVRDDDTGTTSTSKSVTVAIVAIQNDPLIPGTTDLVVGGGNTTDDEIRFSSGSGGTIRVTLNNVVLGNYQPTGRLIAFGQGGNDEIQVANTIDMAAWLYGGNGNDFLKGARGPTLLMGGAGADVLQGGGGRTVMIGGAGADLVTGGSGDDLLIGGSTQFDANDPALFGIVSEWAGPRDYATRVANLRGTGTGPRLNGNYFLTTTTVVDDGATDTFTGGAGTDWFWALGTDIITDLGSGEING